MTRSIVLRRIVSAIESVVFLIDLGVVRDWACRVTRISAVDDSVYWSNATLIAAIAARLIAATAARLIAAWSIATVVVWTIKRTRQERQIWRFRITGGLRRRSWGWWSVVISE